MDRKTYSWYWKRFWNCQQETITAQASEKLGWTDHPPESQEAFFQRVEDRLQTIMQRYLQLIYLGEDSVELRIWRSGQSGPANLEIKTALSVGRNDRTVRSGSTDRIRGMAASTMAQREADQYKNTFLSLVQNEDLWTTDPWRLALRYLPAPTLIGYATASASPAPLRKRAQAELLPSFQTPEQLETFARKLVRWDCGSESLLKALAVSCEEGQLTRSAVERLLDGLTDRLGRPENDTPLRDEDMEIIRLLVAAHRDGLHELTGQAMAGLLTRDVASPEHRRTLLRLMAGLGGSHASSLSVSTSGLTLP